MSNAQVYERVCKFLEENKLASTLQAFRREFDRDSRKNERLKKPVPADISKIRFDRNSLGEVTAVREVLQRADEKVLNRLVGKVSKACNNDQAISNDIRSKLQHFKFYKRLVEREAEAIARRKDKVDKNEISGIKAESSNDISIISKPEEVMHLLQEDVDEYSSDNDFGFEIYDVAEEDLKALCKQIAAKKNFPHKALSPNSSRYPQEYYNKKLPTPRGPNSKDVSQHILLPKTIKFPRSEDSFYPIEYNGAIYDVYDMKVIFNQDKTGFEDHKDFQIVINDVIAGKYQVLSVLGKAQFSRAVQVLSFEDGKHYCMKIISNNKDYVDQSLDEIKLLKYIDCNGNPEEKCVLRFHDYFYHKQHLIIVTELLKDNLYSAYNEVMKKQVPKYFNLKRIQRIAVQMFTALEYIHSLHIIHSDLKPQNVLMKSYTEALIKVIDFGSSIFFHDNLSFYLQTRSYRAPEVIIGVKYDEKIDIWSAGCILAELYTGRVLFENQTVVGLLARIQGIIGGWPEWMVNQGQLSHKFFSKNLVLFEEIFEGEEAGQSAEGAEKKSTGLFRVLIPKKTNLKARLGTKDQHFVDFIRCLLKIDPSQRMSASEALRHPFITQAVYSDND